MISRITLLIALSACAARPVVPVEMRARWEEAPIVRVCASYPATAASVRRVIRRLRRHGAKLVGPVVGGCSGGWPDGEVWLVGEVRAIGGGVVAFVDPVINGGVISSAVVAIGPREAGGLVLEHELLHALGASHVDEPGHILNPQRAYIGPYRAGVREALKQQE